MSKLYDYYDHEMLAMLSRVLNETLAAHIESYGRSLGDAEAKHLATRMGKVIIETFSAGETDPEALKKAAVGSIRNGARVLEFRRPG